MGREIEIPGSEVSTQNKSALPLPADVAKPQPPDAKTAVPSLPAEEQRYRTLIEQLPAILYIAEYGAEGRCYFVGSKIRELLGFEPEDWLKNTRFWIEHIHPEDREKALADEEEAQKNGSNFRSEYRLQHRNGSYRWFRDEGVPIETRPGGPPLLHGVLYDIHESKLMEAARRTADERVRLALDGLGIGCWELDVETELMTWDTNIYRELQVNEATFSRKLSDFMAMVYPEDRAKITEALKQSEADGETHAAEYRVVLPNGETQWRASFRRPVFDGQGKLVRFIGVSQNITQRRKLEEQLRMAQKMEAIGQLAGGVAHDFNNLLTVIHGNSETLLAASAGNAASQQNAEAVLKAADRAAAITRQLLAFSRRQVLQPKVIELGGAVSETANLLRRLLGPAVKLELQLPAHSAHVRADGSQLEQVVLNLVVNARDAMPQGGTVTVSIDRVRAGSSSLRRFPQMRDADYARLTVTDTGTGMDAATRARIFEPFFTTKELGKGTGLGLATVYGIVKQSEGWIWVDSAPGMGTTFEVYLPEVPAPHETEPIPAQRSASLRGTETLLLVDDEEDILELTAGYLGEMGYQVISALSGEDALEKIGGHAGKIDALITDALMPGMPGTQLAKKVRELRPGTRVLYMSGYAEDSGILTSQRRDGEDFLQKPFGLTELGMKIRELLRA